MRTSLALPPRITLDDIMKSQGAFRGTLPDGVLFEINKILLPQTTAKIITVIDIQPATSDPKLIDVYLFGLNLDTSCGSGYPVPRKETKNLLRTATDCTIVSFDLYIWDTMSTLSKEHYNPDGPHKNDKDYLSGYVSKLLMPKSRTT